MGVKQWVATGICCLLIAAAGTRMAVHYSRAEREREQLIAENRALKTRLARPPDERTPLEPEPTFMPATPLSREETPPKAGASAFEGPSDASGNGSPGKVMRAAKIAELLGLEPARHKYFEESYDRLLSGVREAERRHAKISRQGGEVEIHIPPFPDEGGVLREEWSHFLNSALTPFERERYKKLRLDQILFPREIGLWDRHMVFEPQENAVWPKVDGGGNRLWPTLYERWTRPGEKEIDRATRWPWSGPDAYRCYRHLLEP